MRIVLRTCLVLLAALGLPSPTANTEHTSRNTHSRLILWAWEVPERLDFIDRERMAVAYLDQTIYAGTSVRTRPRTQPMQVPPGTEVMAVVRIEIRPAAEMSPAATAEIAAALVRTASRPGVTALQVDFDAVKSQQHFYAELLRQTRREMPPGMPLSVTALASWCAYDRWMAGLPIDEAVPMLFRMGKEQRLFQERQAELLEREPLCSGSRGVSVDEPWPGDLGRGRLYVFNPRPWTEQSVTRVVEQWEQAKK
jgi:hypothetical protein